MMQPLRTFVDIHAHILPGLTHGPANLEEAVKLVKLAEKEGVKALAATPHVSIDRPLDWSQVGAIFDNLEKEVKGIGVDLKLFLGAEVLMSAALLSQVKQAEFPLFGNGRKYLLVEFPPTGIPFYAAEVLFNLQVEGIKPLLAHPERNPAICREPTLLKEFVERGCLVQLNCSSLVGKAGRKVRRCCHKLLLDGVVHLVASDAHSSSAIGLASGECRVGLGGRYFYFSQAFEILKKNVGEVEAVNMTKKRPQSVLRGLPASLPTR